MIVELEKFLTQKECDHVIKLIKANNQPSMVAGGDKRAVSDSSRTSTTCNLPVEDEIVRKIVKKVAMTIGCRTTRIENLQGQLYQKGQEFKDHFDWFDGENYKQHCLASGNRTDTLMIYLNDVPEGGQTEFPKLEMIVEPKVGKALWWKNMIDGDTNKEVVHAGRPVKKGKKYIITAWIRENDWDGAGDAKLSNEYNESKKQEVKMQIVKEGKTFTNKADFPKFTSNGYGMTKFPQPLFEKCLSLISRLKDKEYTETYAGKDSIQPGTSSVYPIWEDPNLVGEIHEILRPMMEEWCGEELESTYIYGFRDYHKGSSLNMHTDRIETHHISAIIMIGKDLTCTPCQEKNPDFKGVADWPLEIVGHDGKQVEVFFEDGDMLFYESAKCDHGRPKVFEGNNYVNFYVHYKLKNWTKANE